MKNKKLIFLIILIIVILSIIFLFNFNKKEKEFSEKINIITTLFPFYDFAQQIGGEKVMVSLLLPPGIDAHSFEPKPSDLVKINQADIFIYTGKFMEPWAENIINSLLNEKIAIIDASQDIKTLPVVAEHQYEHNHDTHSHHAHSHHAHSHHAHGDIDPHIWLDFDLNQIIIDNILKNLIKINPENKNYYENNALIYKEKLKKLDQEYQLSLKNCKHQKIIYGGHYAFNYLVQKYNLEYISAQGFSPNSEPSAKKLIEMIEAIKKENINYIFYEEINNPKFAETLARETNVQLLPLNPAHNIKKDDYLNKKSFIQIMEENLINLKIGLEC